MRRKKGNDKKEGNGKGKERRKIKKRRKRSEKQGEMRCERGRKEKRRIR